MQGWALAPWKASTSNRRNWQHRKRTGRFVSTEDDTLALAVSQRPLPDGGWIATYEDVTERQQTETRIRFLAHYDALTNLPNRVLFRNRMSEALSQLTEDGNDLALLYLISTNSN